jgi:hypothetical protein
MYRGATDSTFKIVQNGLRLYIDAGQLRSYARGGATAWNDLSGFNNNFTIYNGGTFSSNYRGEIQFDGINDYARLRGSTSLPTNDGTVEIWIRSLTNGDNFGTAAYGRAISMSDTTGTGSDTGGAAGSANDFTNYYCLLKNNTADNLSHLFARDINGPNSGGVGFYPSSNSGYVTANALYHHIVITWSSSGSTRSFSSYVNNVNNGNNNYTYNLFLASTMSTVTLAMEASGTNLSPSGPIKCAIGAFRLYNRKLSTAEVAQNWTVERARFGR